MLCLFLCSMIDGFLRRRRVTSTYCTEVFIQLHILYASFSTVHTLLPSPRLGRCATRKEAFSASDTVKQQPNSYLCRCSWQVHSLDHHPRTMPLKIACVMLTAIESAPPNSGGMQLEIVFLCLQKSGLSTLATLRTLHQAVTCSLNP